jgi:hypothetical protein
MDSHGMRRRALARVSRSRGARRGDETHESRRRERVGKTSGRASTSSSVVRTRTRHVTRPDPRRERGAAAGHHGLSAVDRAACPSPPYSYRSQELTHDTDRQVDSRVRSRPPPRGAARGLSVSRPAASSVRAPPRVCRDCAADVAPSWTASDHGCGAAPLHNTGSNTAHAYTTVGARGGHARRTRRLGLSAAHVASSHARQ